MQIKIKATNIQLTDAISSYVEEKLKGVEKFAVHHEGEEPLLEVEIGKTTNHHRSGDIFKAEANLTVHGKNFTATSETSDLYAAIDDLKDELGNELRSYKGKKQTLLRKGAGVVKNLIRFGRAEN